MIKTGKYCQFFYCVKFVVLACIFVILPVWQMDVYIKWGLIASMLTSYGWFDSLFMARKVSASSQLFVVMIALFLAVVVISNNQKILFIILKRRLGEVL